MDRTPPPAADSLDDALAQQVRNPIFEVFRQRLLTVDGIQDENVSCPKAVVDHRHDDVVADYRDLAATDDGDRDAEQQDDLGPRKRQQRSEVVLVGGLQGRDILLPQISGILQIGASP